ncbi:MAG: transcription termination/antitermination factor NusG [Coprobacter sp.]|nr:transcription termination/antitermination factor NusG [Coprobacter sp.]
MSEQKRGWYVLRAISGKEAKVKEYLDAEIKNTTLGDFVYQVLIPTEKVYAVRPNGKKVLKERNLYPGYVFVEATLVGEVPHRLRNTTNVIGFLGGTLNPDPLRPSEVNRMLGAIDGAAEEPEIVIPYVVGETVKVTFGPFSGFSGIIEEVNNEKKKLKVMVKIFGRKTPLELGFMQVEKE